MGDLGNRFDDAAGKAKDAAGKVSGDDALRREGKRDQAKANLKDTAEQATEQVKEKTGEVINKIKDSMR